MAITAGQFRADASVKCGAGYIAQGKKCHKGVGAPKPLATASAPPSPKPGSSRGRKLALGAAAAGAVALGAGLTLHSSRKQILRTPGAIGRAAKAGALTVVHKATAAKPSMKFTGAGMRAVTRDIKKRSLRRKVMLTMEAARRKNEPGYRKPRFADKRRDGLRASDFKW